MRVLVIIVTYNAMRWVDRCIGSALDAGEGKTEVDVFVADNCSKDGTPDWIEENFPDVKLVRNQENLGFGAANNIGLRYAIENGYDYAYLLNQDAWLLPGAMTELVAAAGKGRRYAILSPLQMQADGFSYDPLFGKRNAPSEERRKPYRVRRVMAAHWLVRLSALRKTGLFAPIFEHYGEDDNLCDRLRASGWKIGVVPKAKAVHDRAWRKEPRGPLQPQLSSVVPMGPCLPLYSGKGGEIPLSGTIQILAHPLRPEGRHTPHERNENVVSLRRLWQLSA